MSNHIAKMPKCHCPECGKDLSAATCISEDDMHSQPEPGDLSLCIECGTPLEFDSEMKLHKCKLEDQHPDHQKLFKKAQKLIQQRQYTSQMDTMKERADAWRKANPDRVVMIAYPARVGLIGCISVGLEHGFVKANDAGLDLLKALWPWGGRDEPTVLMCRAVLEYEEK